MTWNRNIPGLLTDDVRLRVPLNRSNPDDLRTIEVYARLVATPNGTDKPYLVFLQGGPGCESPRPTLRDPGFPGWLSRALEDYQLVLLDQRGTGLSSPVSEPVGDAPSPGRVPHPSSCRRDR